MDENYLYRYTNLASLIDLLMRRKIVLLDPNKWEDRNDAAYIKLYGERMGFKSLYALCLTSSTETAHHWNAYAPGTDGVRIEFNKRELIECLKRDKNKIISKKVVYKTLSEVEKLGFNIEDMPFIKRHAFRGEDEYRFFYASRRKLKNSIYEIDLDISCIKRIVIGNELPKALVDSVGDLIHSISGCEEILIGRSTLNYNKRWITAGSLNCGFANR